MTEFTDAISPGQHCHGSLRHFFFRSLLWSAYGGAVETTSNSSIITPFMLCDKTSSLLLCLVDRKDDISSLKSRVHSENAAT